MIMFWFYLGHSCFFATSRLSYSGEYPGGHLTGGQGSAGSLPVWNSGGGRVEIHWNCGHSFSSTTSSVGGKSGFCSVFLFPLIEWKFMKPTFEF